LGDDTEVLHAEAGRFAKTHGVDRLYTDGSMAAAAAEAFGSGAQSYENHEAVSKALEPILDADTTVLVKGSRLSQMERVVQMFASGGTD
jgi:UDP-N-acetylmuramoyl-tripeptide--D-alanyl-D-alanine ligase